MDTTRTPAGTARALLNKVPEVTIWFWVIKILATTVGETAADYLNVTLGFGLTGTTLAVGAVFLVVLGFQFRARRYVPPVYWATVVLISVVGTLITDNLTDNLGVPLEATTAVFAVALALTFAAWYRVERTLSIHSIVTRRRETFYWLTVLVTFALGTATGDLVADTLHLGFFWAGVFFAVLMVVPALGWWRFGLSPVVAFWTAYVLTRPLGASFADWLGKPHSFAGGLGLGDGPVSAVALVLIVVLVGYVAISGRDVQRPLADPVMPDALRPAEEGA
jgi:uncharacterized membrane-anchored protein